MNDEQRGFFAELARAAPGVATIWYVVLVLRSLLPALFAIATGWLVAGVGSGDSLLAPLLVVGVLFTLVQMLGPFHQALSTDLGHRMSDHLNERLLQACLEPDGIAHLERADLMADLTVARDFDLGMTGPPLYVAMDFIADGLIVLLGGVAAGLVLFGYSWWAPFVLIGVWGSTHWLLRESGVWKDRNTAPVRQAEQHADYAYRLAVDPPSAKEIRLFGLGPWVLDRFRTRRQELHDLQYEATRLRERTMLGALVVVGAGNALVFWAICRSALDGDISIARTVVFLQAAIGASSIAFGGLNWALDGAAAPVAAVGRIEAELRTSVGPEPSGSPVETTTSGAPEIRFRSVTFAYPGTDRPVLEGFDLTIPAGSSMAIVGVNGAGKTTAAKLLCRLYEPQSGAVEADGVDLREFGVDAWRSRLTAVFQDYLRLERSLRENVDPAGRLPDDDAVGAALREAGAEQLTDLDTILAKGYPGGTDLSGGQWQRVALARALAAVAGGARLVLLDEPTAQLDVRGEAEIFERVIAATRHCTTILVSHRFQTVRRADRICVLEAGRVAELGSHDELMALGGRYRTMFDLQASRFVEVDDSTGEELVHERLD